MWRGWTTKDNAEAYEGIVRGEVIPGIEARRIPGFRAIDLIRPPASSFITGAVYPVDGGQLLQPPALGLVG